MPVFFEKQRSFLNLTQTVLDWFRIFTAEQWTALFTAFIAFTGFGALIFASRQIKEGRELAKVQHLLDLMKQFEQEPFINYRKKLAAERLRGITDPAELNEVLNFFELIGLLVQRGYLHAEDVWENFGYWVFPLYIDSKSYLESEQLEDVNSYTNLTELYRTMKEIEEKHQGKTHTPSASDILVFWQSESEVVVGSAPKRRTGRRRSQGKGQKAGSLF